jgi:hypothetical protein
MSAFDNDEKRGPGRPRKYPERKPQPRRGIVSLPSNDSNVIELYYNNPLYFKRIWQYFRIMAVEKVHLVFKKDSIIIWCEDHHKHTRMRVHIDCSKMNHYYCEYELDIGILSSNMELIMRTIDKSYTSIYLFSNRELYQNYLEVVLIHDNAIEDNFRVQLIGEYNNFASKCNFDIENDFVIKLEMPSKHFKKRIADIKSLSSCITLRQDSPEDPLILEYMSEDKKIRTNTVIKNSKDIQVVSRLKEDESFRISFSLDYVKPISSVLLSDKITLYAHEQLPLMFVADMDNGAVKMKVITDIIDDRTT